nr:MAG TPA: hypothetical protein [Caudoviricetes sp.]
MWKGACLTVLEATGGVHGAGRVKKNFGRNYGRRTGA